MACTEPQGLYRGALCYFFGYLENFKCVGVLLSDSNNHQIDLQKRIKNVNKTFFMLQNFFINKNISKPKLRLTSTIIDRTLTYASESWILTEIESKETFLKGKSVEEF